MRHWFNWFRRSSRKSRKPSKSVWRLRCYRPNLDVLEDRCLLAAPVFTVFGNPAGQPLPVAIPAGKTLIVPVTGTDQNPGGTVNNISLTAPSGSGVTVTPLSGASFLQINVSHASSGPTDPAFTGTMEFELFGTLTPRTVSYITGLVESGFYNGLIFHRIVTTGPTSQLEAIQGGDPNGNGSGGPPGPGTPSPALQFPDELNSNAIFSGTGQLAMANSGNDTNGSQFFVTLNQPRFLDFNHTIFGQMVRGFDVLSEIDAVPTDANSKPLAPVTMTSVQIVQDPNAAVFLVQASSSAAGSVSLTVSGTSSVTGEQGTSPVPTGVAAGTPNDPPILNINSAPLNFNQASGGPVTNLVTPKDTPVSFTLSSTDLEGDTPKYDVTITDTAKNASVNVNPTSGQVTITPNAGFTGLIHLQATVEDASAGSHRNNLADSQAFTLAVGDAAITATAAPFSVTEGTAATQTVATFTDADTGALPSDFQVSINWGDGTALDTTSGQVTGTNGHYTVKGTHTYAEAGQYSALVTVTDVHTSAGSGTDQGGAMTQATSTATVADAALTVQPGSGISATVGKPLSGVVVATFTDANPSTQSTDYVATIDWGDNTTSAGTIQGQRGVGFQVVGSHTYTTAGPFSVKVTVTDINTAGPLNPSPSTGSATTTATVTAAPATTLTATPVAVTGTAGTAFNVPVATFTDTAANAQASDYTVTINWDDATAPTAGTVVPLGGGQFQVLGSHTYASTGTFSPAVTITSANTGSTPSTLTVNTTASIGAGTLGPAPSSGPTNQSYVNQLFLDLLGTTPTPQQLSDFTSQLNQGKSRQSVVQQIQALPQYKTHQVQLVYQNMFGKGPTSQQVSSGLKVMGKNDDVGKLRVQLLSSADFFNSQGGGTNTGYLNALGRELLHGSLDAATQARLSQRLTNGASRLSVLQDLVQTDLTAVTQQGVQNITQQYLHRAATAAELSADVPLLEKGKENQVIASQVTSNEYFNKTQQTGTTTVTSSDNTSSFGQPVTFTATVAASGASGTPTGTVTFQDVTSGATLGTATLDATGKATFTGANLGVGTHTIRADYAGTGTFPASSGTVIQTVTVAATTTAVTSSSGTSTSGQAVTFTATVTPPAGSSGTPTGTVTFTDTTSGTTLGSAPLDTTGKATLTTSGLGSGTHTITAAYAGSGNYAPSSGNVTQTVS
jgi:cyclophilin family peptidyl-prolyl cis-trans isomerase